MVDAPDLKSGVLGREGSSRSPGILDALERRRTAGCFGREACPYGVYCPALRDLASFASAAPARRENNFPATNRLAAISAPRSTLSVAVPVLPSAARTTLSGSRAALSAHRLTGARRRRRRGAGRRAHLEEASKRRARARSRPALAGARRNARSSPRRPRYEGRQPSPD